MQLSYRERYGPLLVWHRTRQPQPYWGLRLLNLWMQDLRLSPAEVQSSGQLRMGSAHVYAIVASEEPQRLYVRDPIERGQTPRDLPSVPALAESHPGFVPYEECMRPAPG